MNLTVFDQLKDLKKKKEKREREGKRKKESEESVERKVRMISHKRRTNSRAFENLARRAVALLRHFFPVSRFRRYERMHK